MKTFSASDLAHKRTEIFEAAKNDGAILQRKNTNGEVLDEFVLLQADRSAEFLSFGNGGIVMSEELM
jgi:hypothetical protein